MRSWIASLLLVAGCTIGPRVRTFAPAREPRGLVAQVSRGQRRFDAELLAVTDTALLMLDPRAGRILLVPFNATTRVRFPQLPGEYLLRRGNEPSPDQRERLRLLSRFPPGVDAELLSRLLAAYGQDSLRVLPPCTASGC
jgi:hypothetical protein